ncbi:acyltransferase, partial [Bacillus toyonensis]
GEGTAVGAMSMVKESLDDWYIYAGVPVRKVKPRQKKMLELEIDFLKSIHS